MGADAAQSAAGQMPAATTYGANEIASMVKPAYDKAVSSEKTGYSVYNAGVQIDQEKLAIQEAMRKAQEKKDITKYQRVKKANGGFDFYDPSGNKITAADYAAAAGTEVSDVLKGSENPNDLKYMQDAADLTDYIIASTTRKTSQEAQDRWDAINKQVEDKQGIQLWTMKPDEIINKFKQAYPSVYGSGGLPAGTPSPLANPNQVMMPNLSSTDINGNQDNGYIGG